MDSLYEHVAQGLLPQEFGGDAGSLEKLTGMPGIIPKRKSVNKILSFLIYYI
jgi:hypothetical protein